MKFSICYQVCDIFVKVKKSFVFGFLRVVYFECDVQCYLVGGRVSGEFEQFEKFIIIRVYLQC